MTEFYTKLFVDIELKLQALLKLIADNHNGNISMMTVETDSFEIDVSQNKDAAIINDPADFMSFKYIVEVVNMEDTTLEEYLIFTGNVMSKLNACKAIVVAACDWEEKLPGKGRLD